MLRHFVAYLLYFRIAVVVMVTTPTMGSTLIIIANTPQWVPSHNGNPIYNRYHPMIGTIPHRLLTPPIIGTVPSTMVPLHNGYYPLMVPHPK